jgi:hexosaminidase
MKKLISCLFLFFLLHEVHAFSDRTDFEKHFKLVPQPQKIEFFTGKGIPYNFLQAIFLNGAIPRPVLYGALKSLPLADKAGPGVLVLTLTESSGLPDSPESYSLEIKEDGVTIHAKGQAGLFYGCQTLLQLLDDSRDQQITIPPCRITDYPDIPYRAIHLDLKHHLDAGHYYYDMIDRLAGLKINAIIVEFEDKIRYRKAPLVAASHAITVEEFAAISRYAKDRNVEISPLVQGLGHASFILKHPEYKKLRDNPASDWSFDPLLPETYDLQFSLYEDAIAATPYGKYLHVGGDEVGDLGQSDLSKKSGLKPMQLQMQWLKKVCEFARSHDRIPIFWDDMVFKLAGLYETTYDSRIPLAKVEELWKEKSHLLDENSALFPKECVYMRWNYDTPDLPGNHKALEWYKTHHLKVMAATSAQTQWPMLPRDKSNFQPIKDFCRITSENKLDGILCTGWDDSSPHFETYWRGFYNFAFFSWHPEDVGADEVQARFRQRFYSPAVSDSSFEFQNSLEKALAFWETALIEKGHRTNYPRRIDLIGLPDPSKPGQWANQYSKRIAGAKEAVSNYELIKKKIEKSEKLALRNAYSLSLMREINELQIYPARLLLLLEKYDKTPEAGKPAVRQEIKKQVDDFSQLRQRYENVFTETRILRNPDDYLMDENQHQHLANAMGSDWMYVFELAMNNKINNWVSVASNNR